MRRRPCVSSVLVFLITVVLILSSCAYGNFRYGYRFKVPKKAAVYKNKANLDYLVLRENENPDSFASFAGIYVEEQKGEILSAADYVASLISALALTADESIVVEKTFSKKKAYDSAVVECVQKYEQGEMHNRFFIVFRKHLVYVIVASGEGGDYAFSRDTAAYMFETLDLP